MSRYMKEGKFITFEGSEGVGKSTNILLVKEHLESQNIDLLLTREPGGTPLAENIRALLLNKSDEKIDETCELLMVFAARAQHLNTVIIPALNKGVWVLCDRFTDSTYAYQGGGRGLNTNLISELEKVVQQGLMPDLTFYLDIDVRLGLSRASARAELDRFESEEIDFFERVRFAYLERVKTGLRNKHYRLIDAGQELALVQQNILASLDEFLASLT
jgi:dTMP kinase